jgi:drug/metabolite transporter (DMT)-like permease
MSLLDVKQTDRENAIRQFNERRLHILAGAALAVIGSITFSGKAIIVKLGYRYGSDAVTLLMLRMLFALPIFLLMAWWAGRNKATLTKRDWIGVLGLGFSGFYLASVLDFAGLKYITASLERLILCLQPTLVLIFGFVFFKRNVRGSQIVGIMISYAGVLVVFGRETWLAYNQSVILGTSLVFLSTVSYATYLLLSGSLVARLGSMRLVGLATSVACILSILHFFISRSSEDLSLVTQEVVLLSLLNATLCTAVPVLSVMMAIERVGPAMSSQIGMIGPIFTIMLGVLILDEPFTAWVALGAVLVVAGILAFTWVAAERPAKSETNPAATPPPAGMAPKE